MGARKLEKYLTRQFEEHVSRASIERAVLVTQGVSGVASVANDIRIK